MLSHHKEIQHKVYGVSLVFCDKKYRILRLAEDGDFPNTAFFFEKYRHTLIYFSDHSSILQVVSYLQR